MNEIIKHYPLQHNKESTTMRTLTGLLLIDAQHSALNNAGTERRGGAKNTTVVKKVRLRGDSLPYVSPQAFRNWWRMTTLEETRMRGRPWRPSPITRGEDTAYTEGNPILYEDDDLFGYMLTTTGEGEEPGTAHRRISPLKCSPLVSVLSNVLTTDEGSMARQEGGVYVDAERNQQFAPGFAVRYNQEFYATVLKGLFSLTLDTVGVFDVGLGYDVDETRRQAALQRAAQETTITTGTQAEGGSQVTRARLTLPEDIRKQRIEDLLLSLPVIRGGAKLSPYLTDVTPKFIVMSVLSCSNHIFMEVVREANDNAFVDLEALREILTDFADRILSPVYIGLRKGFLEKQRSELLALANEQIQVSRNGQARTITFSVGTPNQAIENVVQFIRGMRL
jgi:CRISPR-associated protein Cst2